MREIAGDLVALDNVADVDSANGKKGKQDEDGALGVNGGPIGHHRVCLERQIGAPMHDNHRTADEAAEKPKGLRRPRRLPS
jgi:hypothetical protein